MATDSSAGNPALFESDAALVSVAAGTFYSKK